MKRGKDYRKVIIMTFATVNTVNGHKRRFWEAYTSPAGYVGCVEYTGRSDHEWLDRFPNGRSVSDTIWLTASEYRKRLKNAPRWVGAS